MYVPNLTRARILVTALAALVPATHAVPKPTKLYCSMLLEVICHALLACVAYPHITTVGAYFSKTPFPAPTTYMYSAASRG